MEERLSDNELAVWRAFLTAHAFVIRRIEHELAAAGTIPLTWYDVLIELYEAPDNKMRLHELADAIVLSRSGLTRLLDRLERAGLIVREVAEVDRRGSYAVLTDAGTDAMRRAWPVYARGIKAYFARHLRPEEHAILWAALERVIACTPADASD
jgi:DNA-binding MarR family transcriptional regulator